MSKKIVDIILIFVVAFALLGLGGCASGGGSAGIVAPTSPTYPASGTKSGSEYCGSGDNQYNLYQNYHDGNGGTTTTLVESNSTSCGYTESVVDNRIAFEEFSYSFENSYGDVKVTYGMAPHTTEGLADPTEKFKIADYGFMRVTIDGKHGGSSEGAESTAPGPFANGGYWFEADLNGDEHVDMYFVGHTDGALEWVPPGLLMAFINDGNGHFRLAPEVFENGEFPCIWGGGPQVDKTDPLDPCGFAQSNNYPLIADFNGDGMTDFFSVSMLYLSDNGIIKNKSHDNLPDLFFLDHIGPIFSHRVDDGDVDGDGDLDIFLPIKGDTKSGYMFDGSYAGCEGCNQQIPWTMLINDGTGYFTANHNFNIPDWDYESGTLIWATSTTIDDFNNDGWGDVAVGWESPGLALSYGWLDNSAGNVYFNNGSNDWRTDPVNLPENWYGANGIGVDMDSFDFNGDGFTDIVLSTTRHDPYYQGNIVQFFLNDGTGNFSDVTTTFNPSYAKYENGSGNDFWNGGGIIHILDFDHDGDLDIVRTTGRSYVLLNEGDHFSLYDDFPIWEGGGGGVLWPVEIDGKYWYDFISSVSVKVDEDTQYTDYFQVLDPPAMAELMYIDLFTKPNAYRDLGNIASKNYGGAFYVSRFNDNKLKLFYHEGEDNTEHGVFAFFEDFGLGYTNGEGIVSDSNSFFKYYSDSFIVYTLKNNFYIGLGYNDTSFDNKTNTVSYGAGFSNVDAQTLGLEVSYRWTWKNFKASFGIRQNETSVDGFTDYGDTLELSYDSQNFSSTNLISTLEYNKYFSIGGQDAYIGFDIEHIDYADETSAYLAFTQGGAHTSTYNSYYDEEYTFASLNLGLIFNKASMNLALTNSDGYESATLSLNLNF
jgi:hypothetical protein